MQISTRTTQAALAKTVLAGAALAMVLTTGAYAAPDMRDVVRTKHGDIVVNSFGNCVRTKWQSNEDACGKAAPRAVSRARQLQQQERTVYFEFNKSQITPHEQQKLDSLANVLKSDKEVKEVKIVGYADRIGSISYNDRLSQRRAKAVESYLRSRGYLNTSVTETRWFGENNPVTQCPDTLSRPDLIACLAQDRRVEVEMEFLPEETMPYPANRR